MSVGGVVFFYLTLTGITRWSGRSLTLLDPTYAKKYIPIIASVSEHQPTTWGVFFMDLQNLLIFMPVGLFFCFRKVTFGSLFLALYGVLAVYFSCVMIRLLLVLAPSVCVLAGIGISEVTSKMVESVKNYLTVDESPKAEPEADQQKDEDSTQTDLKKSKGGKKGKSKDGSKSGSIVQKIIDKPSIPIIFAILALVLITSSVSTYVFHSVTIAAEAYSSPSVVLAGRRNDGSKYIIDDFRESYGWL